MSRIHGNNGSKKVRVIMAAIVNEAPFDLVFFSSARGHSGTFFQLAARPVTRLLPSTVLRAHFQYLSHLEL